MLFLWKMLYRVVHRFPLPFSHFFSFVVVLLVRTWCIVLSPNKKIVVCKNYLLLIYIYSFYLQEQKLWERVKSRLRTKYRSLFAFLMSDVIFLCVYKQRCNPSLSDGSELCTSLALIEKALRKFSLLESSILKGLGISLFDMCYNAYGCHWGREIFT